MDFSAKKVGDSIWPEVGAVAILLAAKMGTKYVKEAKALTGWKNPEYYLDGAAIGVPLYLIGTDKAVDESKAVLWAEVGLVGERAARYAYDRTIGKSAKKIGRGKIKGNPALTAVEQAQQIAAARELQTALALRNKQPVSARAGMTEF